MIVLRSKSDVACSGTCLVVVVEGRVASQKNICDDADAPHVHGCVVLSAKDDCQARCLGSAGSMRERWFDLKAFPTSEHASAYPVFTLFAIHSNMMFAINRTKSDQVAPRVVVESSSRLEISLVSFVSDCELHTSQFLRASSLDLEANDHSATHASEPLSAQ